MKIDRSVKLIPVALLAVSLLAACSADNTDRQEVKTTVSVAPSTTASSLDDVIDDIQASNSAAQESLKAEISEAAEVSEVPDVVGMNHREAMTVLHTAGFLVNEEDASPEGRWILDNSNWKVCSQDPAPGTTDVIRVAIYSVKLDESC